MSARGSAASLLPVARPTLLVALAATVGIFHVWSETRVITAGYRLGELQRARAALQAERNRLEVEVATLRAPGRLERFARERLGMAPPAAGAVVAGRAGGSEAGRAGRVGVMVGHPPSPAEPASWGARAPPGRDGRLASREAMPPRRAQP